MEVQEEHKRNVSKLAQSMVEEQLDVDSDNEEYYDLKDEERI